MLLIVPTDYPIGAHSNGREVRRLEINRLEDLVKFWHTPCAHKLSQLLPNQQTNSIPPIPSHFILPTNPTLLNQPKS
jgi:hypothetical protein